MYKAFNPGDEVQVFTLDIDPLDLKDFGVNEAFICNRQSAIVGKVLGPAVSCALDLFLVEEEDGKVAAYQASEIQPL